MFGSGIDGIGYMGIYRLVGHKSGKLYASIYCNKLFLQVQDRILAGQGISLLLRCFSRAPLQRLFHGLADKPGRCLALQLRGEVLHQD